MPTDKELLTRGGRLLIMRKRLGLSQAAAAARWEVPHGVYGRWERGQPTPGYQGVPREAIGVLLPHERCLLLRLRAGTSQQEVADAMGVCRYWVGLMERGAAPTARLEAFWVEEYEW